MENGPIEDVFPIEHGDIPASYVSLLEASLWWKHGLNPQQFVERCTQKNREILVDHVSGVSFH